MKRIFKFRLWAAQYTECVVPVGAVALCAQIQDDEPHVWVMCDPLLTSERRRFYVYGTGHEILNDDRLRYIGTCQQANGLVWHVFEETQSTSKVEDV